MATINDVAKKAFVSKATVSRYINGKKVASNNAKKIDKAISDLNFTPNRVAQGLSNQKSDIIGVIVPDLLNPFFSEIVNTIERTAFADNISCLIFSSDNNSEIEAKAIEICNNFNVQGIVLAPVSNKTDLKDYLIPIVTIDRYLKTSIKNIQADNKAIGKKIINYFFDKKVSNILLIEGDSTLDTTIKRREAFIKEALKKNMNYTVISSSFADVYKVYEDIKELDLNNFDGICMGNEIIAFGVLKNKLRDDIVKVTVDGTYLNNFLLDDIFTIRQPINDLATLAYQKVINWDNIKETTILDIEAINE
ncbi:LacI family transcriptional regulator [Erysipelotrichaceae bacterium OttesenSCG-928-M19]|nr:LacI family transcriptional regulator [Erysipelotrichaceae bacterium OttesenSCG-928-M19]